MVGFRGAGREWGNFLPSSLGFLHESVGMTGLSSTKAWRGLLCCIVAFAFFVPAVGGAMEGGRHGEGTGSPPSAGFLQCMIEMEDNMPIHASTGNRMVVHHYKAGTGKWNENDRWQPLPLNESSVVVYVGAHENGVDGLWLVENYDCFIHVIEPVPQYFKMLEEQWANVSKARLHNFGLGKNDRETVLEPAALQGQETFTMGISAVDEDGVQVHIRDAHSAIKSMISPVFPDDVQNDVGLHHADIDLLHVNCEGCEWEMFERLIETDSLGWFQVIQFGSHWFAGIVDIEQRYCQIRESLNKTHEMAYGEFFGWERWYRRG